MSHWVLTRSVNAYDQHGDYYDASWDNKPTAEMIMRINPSIKHSNAAELLERGYSQETPYPGEWESWELIKVGEQQ